MKSLLRHKDPPGTFHLISFRCNLRVTDAVGAGIILHFRIQSPWPISMRLCSHHPSRIHIASSRLIMHIPLSRLIMAAAVSRLGHLGAVPVLVPKIVVPVSGRRRIADHTAVPVLCKLIQLSALLLFFHFIPVSFYQFSVALFSVAVFPLFLSLYRKAVLDPRHCAVQFKPHLSVRIFSCQFRQYFAHRIQNLQLRLPCFHTDRSLQSLRVQFSFKCHCRKGNAIISGPGLYSVSSIPVVPMAVRIYSCASARGASSSRSGQG